jgi:hypothetical protein
VRWIFAVTRPLSYQTGGFNCSVRPEVDYFNLRTLENNPRWRTKCFYAKDQPTAGQNFGIKEFRAASDLRPRLSWAHTLTSEEMSIIEPLMKKIAQLRSTPGKEVTGHQLIRTFIKSRVQPLAARVHCMWDYTGHRDPTQITFDELKEVEIDDGVRVVTSLTKRNDVPKNFGMEAFSKTHPRTEVCAFAYCLIVEQIYFYTC